MEKDEIVSILSKWNFWGELKEVGVGREEYLEKTLKFLRGVNKIVSVFGVRRAGKSYLLRQLAKKLSEAYGDKNILMVNFEETRFDEPLNKKFLLKIYEAFQEIVKPEREPFLLLDEIQEVDEWERFVRSLHEKNEARIVVTGSSSKLMSEELATLLAGRDVRLEIFPLSFKEFLKFRAVRIKDRLDLLKMVHELKVLLREFIEFGGFPEIAIEMDEEKKLEILRRYVETIVIKDVERRFKIKNPEKLETLVRYYLSNFSSLATFRSISRFTRIPLKTLERYSRYLEISRMLFFVKKFSFSPKEREVAARKVYAIDNGLISSSGLKLSENIGRLVENLVAVELLRRYREIFYYKVNEREIDFVIGKGEQLIQVTYASTHTDIKERELNSLVKAAKVLRCKNLLVITWDYETKMKINNKTIKFMPLWKWLLEV